MASEQAVVNSTAGSAFNFSARKRFGTIRGEICQTLTYLSPACFLNNLDFRARVAALSMKAAHRLDKLEL